MALEQKLNLRLSQRLVMTPSLQQAIKLLQMSKLELQDVLTQEIVENPLLEEEEEAAAAETSTEAEVEADASAAKEPDAEAPPPSIHRVSEHSTCRTASCSRSARSESTTL